MKILFLCPSLEASKSGVGDYVVSLAIEIANRGHHCICLSVNDISERFISPPNEFVSIVRLSSNKPWTQRQRRIQEIINQFSPDWISLQYVPYGYDYKGLPLRFAYILSSISSNAKWHFMFHELWIGISRNSPVKHKLIGFFQRTLVMLMSTKISPSVVHTTNPLYVYLLSTINVDSKRLPLFGNISIDKSEINWMLSQLKSLGILPFDRKNWFIVGMFGSIYPDFPLEVQLLKLATLLKANNKSLAVIGLGGGVGTGDAWEKRVFNVLPNAKVRHFGLQNVQRVSAFLSTLDLALPTTPLEFIGKSSAVASMVLHSVPLDLSYRMNSSEFNFLNQSSPDLSKLFSTLGGVCDKLLKEFSSQS
jgi:hypothetical protein